MGLYAEADIIAADGTKIPANGLLEIVSVDTITGHGEFSVDLPVGSRVYLKEYSTNDQYILSNQKYPLVFEYAGQDVPLVELTANNGKPIENTIKRGNVEGLKVDENGEALAGALIGLFAPDTIEFTEDNALLTDISRANGAFSFEGVPYGEWVCREIATPGPQYVLDDTVYPVNVTADKQIIKIRITNIFVRGDIEGLKLDEDGQGLEGALIGLFNPDETVFTADNAVMTAISADNGAFTFEGVLYGDWIVREIATPEARYVLDETLYPVTVSYHKQIINVEITDIYVRGFVRGLKLDEDCKGLAGAVIGLFNPDETEFTEDNAVMVTTSDSRGRFSFDGILWGDWVVREIAPPRAFILSDISYPVTVSTHKQIIRVVVSNTLIRGSVEGLKVDEDGEGLAGALIGLFYADETEFTADNAVMTSISAEDGSFSFTEVVFGDWTVREIAPSSAAYVLNDEIYPITIADDGEIIKIEIENRYVRGSVRTTKVDTEYPDNKLSGAVFDVYADTNGNGEFDEDIDIFIGTLDEIATGVYQLDGLKYGGFFLWERTSPDLFLLDENYYYFEILTDGEIIDVENQAGIGFVNQPAYGELWLTKKDVSDGKLIPNCGIRIKDENGNTVIEGRTDENGEVKFRLRAGKYTYSEFDCPGYILDESEYPFEITEDGQIIKAEMTNEKIPEPEKPEQPPKTGDTSNMALWLALMGASAGALVLTVSRRKKNYGTR
jgi:LPXTG-motif cell wall-anchored protein